MDWDQIAGQQKLKEQLQNSIINNRVSHAQLFLGKEGYGTLPLALAYAKAILRNESEASATRVAHLNHLDLHFSFPVYSEKNKALSSRLYPQFREMILENPYADFEDWSNLLESQNKQLFISSDEIADKNEKFSLKSFEGGTKVLIIWRADKMNESASNKLLKFLEEPPAKTIILLTAATTDDLLPTILSRTQIVEVPAVQDEELGEFLQNQHGAEESRLGEIVQRATGNVNNALRILRNESSGEFEELFIQWVRDAFQVKKKPEFLKNIIMWARNIASWNREKQKNFLDYCSEMFRLAMLQNYGLEHLIYKKIDQGSFNWDSFTRFIHGANIQDILDEITTADYHLQRNANARIVWTDMGIKLSRYIHKAP